MGAEGLGIVAAGDFWGDSFASWPAFAGKSAAAELGRAVAAYGMILLSICGGGFVLPFIFVVFQALAFICHFSLFLVLRVSGGGSRYPLTETTERSDRDGTRRWKRGSGDNLGMADRMGRR